MNPTLAAAIAEREQRGLKLTFDVPGRPADLPFTCYAKDEAQKQAWLEKAAAYGWTLIADESD